MRVVVDSIVRSEGERNVIPMQMQANGVSVRRVMRTNTTRKERDEARAKLGRELWSELHARPMTQHQFEEWCNRVPAFGCSCRKDLLAYIDKHPVDWDNFYEWGVLLHDAVNVKLGKPVWDRTT